MEPLFADFAPPIRPATPLRAAISGDGRHGFTAGFMTLRTADGKESPLKYLAYWEKQAAGWRVVVYKRGGAKSLPPLTPSSPPLMRSLRLISHPQLATSPSPAPWISLDLPWISHPHTLEGHTRGSHTRCSRPSEAIRMVGRPHGRIRCRCRRRAWPPSSLRKRGRWPKALTR
jgi:hypothetical protein